MNVIFIEFHFTYHIFFVFLGSEKVFKTELANSNSNHVAGDINRRRLMHRAKTKSLRISVVIVAAFVIWWTPYYSMMIIFMFLNPDKHVSISYSKLQLIIDHKLKEN